MTGDSPPHIEKPWVDPTFNRCTCAAMAFIAAITGKQQWTCGVHPNVRIKFVDE